MSAFRADNYRLHLTVGYDFEWSAIYLPTGDDSAPMDWDGYTGAMDIKLESNPTGEAVLSCTVTLGDGGTVRLHATDEVIDASAIEPGQNYVYDVRITNPDDNPDQWMAGPMVVKQGVTGP